MKIAVAAGIVASRQTATKRAIRSSVAVQFKKIAQKNPENPENCKMKENVILLQK